MWNKILALKKFKNKGDTATKEETLFLKVMETFLMLKIPHQLYLYQESQAKTSWLNPSKLIRIPGQKSWLIPLHYHQCFHKQSLIFCLLL